MYQSQNVGINTENPTRKLDVNGDVRVTALPNVSGNANYPMILSADRNNGNVDDVTAESFMQSDVNNVEVKRSIYNAAAADDNRECSCGNMTFRINSSNLAEIKLNSDNIFMSLNTTAFELDYGIKRWTSTYYNYFNDTVNFTTSNYSTYQMLDPEYFNSNNTIRIYTIILPKQNNLYRLTLSKLVNTPTNNTFSLICEKFYIQNL